MSDKHVTVGEIDCGSDKLFLISGPCAVEDASLMGRVSRKACACSRPAGVLDIQDLVKLGLPGQDRL